MKKTMIFILALLLVGCSVNTDKEKDKAAYCDDGEEGVCSITKSADMSSYENFTDKSNQFVKSNMKEMLTMFKEKKSGVVYLGYPDCPWCIEALPVMNEIAKAEETKISYVQTRDSEKKLLYSEEEKKELIPYVEQYLNKDEDGAYQLYVPFMVVIKDGKAVAGHIGTVDGHDAHERKMTKEESEDLKKIYQEMFDKL